MIIDFKTWFQNIPGKEEKEKKEGKALREKEKICAKKFDKSSIE